MIQYAGHTKEEWFSLPIKLRQRYWQETDYGRIVPSTELTEAIAALLKVRESGAVR